MALPLESTLRPGGIGVLNSLQNINAVTKSNLENQYYGPNIQSEINQRNALTQGQLIENQYAPDKLRLANQLAALQNQYYAPNILSEIGQRKAETNKLLQMTPLEAAKMRLENENYQKNQDIENKLKQAQAQYYGVGGGRAGVGAKDDALFQSYVAKDNPQLTTPEQIYQASNIISNGGITMPDGTPLMVSPAAQRALDRSMKTTTTAALITSGVRGNQAEAELPVLSSYAQKWMKPYGRTFLDQSPEAIVDSFSSDEESQKKLGRLLAAQQIQYEIAQNEIKLANGEPGVTSTQELMDLGKQHIDTKLPSLSATARTEAQRAMIEALQAGFKARKNVGVGASSIVNRPMQLGVTPTTVSSTGKRVLDPRGNIYSGSEENIKNLLKDHPNWTRIE